MTERKDLGWKEPSLVRSYLNDFRDYLPLAEEQLDIMMRVIGGQKKPVQRFLDLGCGDGILGATVLGQYPTAAGIFLDFSKPMLEAAREKLKDFMEQCEFLKVDYCSSDWVSAVVLHSPFDVIVSGYSIHHQSHKRKRELYTEIHDLLEPGGVFINIEHVASASSYGESLYDQYLIDAAHAEAVKRGGNKALKQVAQDLNRSREDKEANILGAVEDQCQWLREIGFEDVDCFFKVFELAIFGGRRSEGL
jgi:ubiquinone/menaquinone biosynthesis C-methylase UbiE